MPPRRKRGGTAQKAQLLFHHQPLEGPRRRSGAPPRPVTHTREAHSRPIDHSTSTSWVTPQFDLSVGSCLADHRKRHHQDRARYSRRKSAPKFPHLSFESPEPSLSSATLARPSITEPPKPPEKKVCRSPLIPVLSPQSQGQPSGHARQSFPHAFIPSDIQTPGPASTKEGPATPEQRKNSLLGCSLHTGTPKSTEPGPVLVEDTPEEKYGIKVTWRRRQQLLAHLQERGKLSRSQVHVKI